MSLSELLLVAVAPRSGSFRSMYSSPQKKFQFSQIKTERTVPLCDSVTLCSIMRERLCSIRFPLAFHCRCTVNSKNPAARANCRALFLSNGTERNGRERNGRSVLTILKQNGWNRKLFFEGYCMPCICCGTCTVLSNVVP